MAKQEAIEAAVIVYSNNVIKGAGFTAFGAGISQQVAETTEMLTLADIGVIAGIAGVMMGLVVNAVAQWRRDRREKELHKLRVEAIKSNSCEDVL